MNQAEIEKLVAGLSEEQKQQLLAIEVPEEIEKEAADEAATQDLQDALYAYGAFQADLEVEAEAAGDAGLSKEASSEFAEVEQEIAQAIETGVQELGLDQVEDESELHKQAMAAATIIFEGYTDQLEKVAAKGGKLKALAAMVGKKGKAAAGKVRGAAAKAGKHVAKNKKAYLAGAATGALGYGAGRMHEKKASELTAQELVELTLQKQDAVDLVCEGVEKLAAHAVKKALKAAKSLGKKHGKTVGVGAGAGLAGYVAGRMGKKDK